MMSECSDMTKKSLKEPLNIDESATRLFIDPPPPKQSNMISKCHNNSQGIDAEYRHTQDSKSTIIVKNATLSSPVG